MTSYALLAALYKHIQIYINTYPENLRFKQLSHQVSPRWTPPDE